VTDGLPALHSLRCFEAAARHQSMSRAADELHLTHGAISRQVRQVEAHLGAALFVRSHRRLTLTREGTVLAEATARALQTLRDGLTDVRRLGNGPLVLSCEPTLTLAWLIPRLARLDRDLGLEVHVVQGGGPIDLLRDSVDVALRRADFDLEGHHVAPVMDEWLGPVCAPRLLAQVRRGAALDVLHTRTRPEAWAQWSAATGRRLPAGRRRSFDHFSTSIQAAIAGLGLAIGPCPLVHDELAARRLVAPFGFVPGELGYVLLSRRPFADDPRAARLLEWLRAEAARTQRRAQSRSWPRR
jgi:LysR family transcriptional regulator, glycine cleavage system transcriptional activator